MAGVIHRRYGSPSEHGAVDAVAGSASGTEAGGRALEGVVSDETPWAGGEFGVGSEVAGYRLGEQIGRGGMAVVYLAHDPRLDRRVALKILAPELARDEGFRQRFIRESRAAAAVDHRHIIPVFGAGESGNILFIAMRYVEGGDVRTLIDQVGPLPVDRAVRIIAQVASALDAAHAHGLIHRDVKPGNMLLDSSDGSDHVYLSDFGLSKQALSSSHLTATGQFLGTLDYVAPEQIEGRPMDGRVDLYALGCAAFEMLSGSPPFRREQRLAVLWAQMSEAPPALTALRPDLPSAVDQVLAKAMAKSPEDRYGRCGDFASALREACGLGSSNSSPPQAKPVHADTTPEAAAPGPGQTAVGSAGTPSASPAESPAVAAASQPESEQAEPSRPATEVASEPAGEQAQPPHPPTEAAASQPASEQPQPPPPPPTEAGSQPGSEQGEPSRPATEVSRPVRRPREIIRPAAAAAAGAGGAADAAGPPTQAGGRDYQATQAGGPGRPSGPQQPGSGGPPGPAPPAGGGRPWWRSPVALIAGCVVVLGLAGGAYAVTRGSGGKGTGTASQSTGGAIRTVTLSPPGCTTSIAAAPVLSKVRTSMVHISGQAYAIAVTGKGDYSFVSVPSGPKSSISVMRNGTGLVPTFVRSFAVNGKPHSETITPDGRYLLVADHDGALVINVADAEQGKPDPVAGTLSSPGGSNAAQVKVSPDGQFAFVTLEDSNEMAVFNLKEAIASGFSSSHLVGTVPLPFNPLGMALSPDGRWLYVTTGNLTKTSPQGGLNIIDVHKAETAPSSALKTTVPAGCFPVRIILTNTGKYLWVTARDSNSLLGFSAANLLSDQPHALVAVVRVGQEPIGLTLVDKGDRILVANSNILLRKGATTSLGVVSTSLALAGKPALLGVIPAGKLPRQFAMEPNGKTLLVANSTSEQLQAVDVTNIP